MMCADCKTTDKKLLNISYYRGVYICDNHKLYHQCSCCKLYSYFNNNCGRCESINIDVKLVKKKIKHKKESYNANIKNFKSWYFKS